MSHMHTKNRASVSQPTRPIRQGAPPRSAPVRMWLRKQTVPLRIEVAGQESRSHSHRVIATRRQPGAVRREGQARAARPSVRANGGGNRLRLDAARADTTRDAEGGLRGLVRRDGKAVDGFGEAMRELRLTLPKFVGGQRLIAPRPYGTSIRSPVGTSQ